MSPMWSWLWVSPENSTGYFPILGYLQSLLVERVTTERAETQGILLLRQLRKPANTSISWTTLEQKPILSMCTSAADTKESVEPMLTVSLQHESSKSSLNEPPGFFSSRKPNESWVRFHKSTQDWKRLLLVILNRLTTVVRRRIRKSQSPFELLLEPIGPLQQRLQLTDELATDDVLFENDFCSSFACFVVQSDCVIPLDE